MSDIDPFDGFSWAVPRAFSAAVHACRFEQGDVLYSDAEAYNEKSRSQRPTRYHIQVLDPPRSARALAGDGEGQRFFSNWESPVTFEWMDYEQGASREVLATQGGLFTCLWKGDIHALEAESREGLERPLLLRDLQSQLAEHVDAIADCTTVAENDGVGVTAKKSVKSAQHVFALAIDQSSDSSRVKAQSIVRALEAAYRVRCYEFAPGTLSMAEAARFHPALTVFALAVDSGDEKGITGVLRDALYAGGTEAGKEGGRFSLARHGCLLPLP